MTSASDGDGGGDDATGDGGSDEGLSGSESGIQPKDCEPGFTWCDVSCVSTPNHPGHCGECFHSCKGASNTETCRDSQCEPAYWPCITPGLGVETCSDACALIGETCVDEGAKCSGSIVAWLDYAGGGVDSCMQLVGPNTGFDLGCADAIPWDYTHAGQSVAGVACCCTQP